MHLNFLSLCFTAIMIISLNIMITVQLGHKYPQFSFCFVFQSPVFLALANATRTSLFFINYIAIHAASFDTL